MQRLFLESLDLGAIVEDERPYCERSGTVVNVARPPSAHRGEQRMHVDIAKPVAVGREETLAHEIKQRRIRSPVSRPGPE